MRVNAVKVKELDNHRDEKYIGEGHLVNKQA
jgi:hypothetical protein